VTSVSILYGVCVIVLVSVIVGGVAVIVAVAVIVGGKLTVSVTVLVIGVLAQPIKVTGRT
jgi:hypothetical protein